MIGTGPAKKSSRRRLKPLQRLKHLSKNGGSNWRSQHLLIGDGLGRRCSRNDRPPAKRALRDRRRDHADRGGLRRRGRETIIQNCANCDTRRKAKSARLLTKRQIRAIRQPSITRTFRRGRAAGAAQADRGHVASVQPQAAQHPNQVVQVDTTTLFVCGAPSYAWKRSCEPHREDGIGFGAEVHQPNNSKRPTTC